jgi:hypothetical protein
LSLAVGARIVAETGGNPLALVEVARELSPGQLAGSEALPELLPAGRSLEKVFGRRVSQLPPEARLLAVAAAEPAASHALLWRVPGQLGIDPEAAASADLGDLAEFTPPGGVPASPDPFGRLPRHAAAAATPDSSGVDSRG